MDWRETYREWLERNSAPGAVEMTQEEWQRCPLPSVMLRFLYSYPSARKRRLFAVACLRRVSASIPPAFLPFVDVAEDFAEGRASAEQLEAAATCVYWMHDGDESLFPEGYIPPCEYDETLTSASKRFVYGVYRALGRPAAYAHPSNWSANDAAGWVSEILADAASYLPEKRTWDNVKIFQERASQADLLRDIYGDPFHPVIIDPALQTAEVIHLAQSIYDKNEFNRMPLLTEAMRMAGCQDITILAHGLSVGPHVRGCWLLDHLLGKS